MSEPTDGHIDALTLDALAFDAIEPAIAAIARAHLATCARCRGEAETATSLREHFEHVVLPRTSPRAERRWPWWAAIGPMFALAAVLVTFVAMRKHGPAGPELGVKGDASWQVFANRSGETFAVRDGAPLMAGDRIRFVVTPHGAPYLLVASIDGTGTTSIYYPYGGDESAAVTGARVELPGSIVLDHSAGPERLYAVLSDVPIAADAIKAELRAIGADARAIRQVRHLNVASRTQLSIVFEKAQP